MRALQAAKHACEASGWTLTNLQLQKILYIAHMVHLGRTGQPLIDDQFFEAWDYGPVLPSVYRHVSGFGSRPIANVFAVIEDANHPAEIESIRNAVGQFANIEPFQLVQILHDERSAWRGFYNPNFRNTVIPTAAVLNEYRNRFQ
ncbi:MAG TPA: hypothetical protein DD803_06975 [Alcaligenes faecalis]|nr:hypothetical protein [Alcaligenes faecalis]